MSRGNAPTSGKLTKERLARRRGDTQLRQGALSEADINALIAQYLIDNPPSGGTGGGVFSTREIVSGTFSITTGQFLIPPAGTTHVRLSYLRAAGATSQPNVYIRVDGVNTSTFTLAGTTPTLGSDLFIGSGYHGSTSNLSQGTPLPPIVGEEIYITKTGTSGGSQIFYVAEYGVII